MRGITQSLMFAAILKGISGSVSFEILKANYEAAGADA